MPRSRDYWCQFCLLNLTCHSNLSVITLFLFFTIFYHGEKEEKCPNINEKAKKEVHHDKETHGRSGEIDENTPLDEIKGPNVFERAKEEIEAVVEAIHPGKCPNNIKKAKKELHHDKETHGRSGKIDENTPLDEIKGPSVVEVEAVVRAILHGK